MGAMHYYLPERWQSRVHELQGQLQPRRGRSGCTAYVQACLAAGGGEEADAWQPPPQPQHEDSREVIYGGDLGAQSDPLPEAALLRLWCALARPDLNCPIAFTLPPQQEGLPELLTALMELAGLGGRALPVSTPTCFARVLDPEPCAGPEAGQGYDAAALGLLPAAAAAALPAAEGGRLYLSRCGGAHPAWGEEYFEDFFAARGYEIIRPGQLPARELLARVAAAGALACTEGPLARLALLARPGTRFTCLCAGRPAPWLLLLIARVRQLEGAVVDVGLNLLPAVCGCDGSLIGPSRHWREFMAAELVEETEGDALTCLGGTDLPVGGYISAYMQRFLQRGQMQAAGAPLIDHIGYVQALFDTFAPGGFDEVRQALCICEHPFFCDRRFVVRRFGTQEEGLILLRGDGGTEVQGRSQLVLLQRCRHWSFFGSRLNLMDDDCRLVAQFIVVRDENLENLSLQFTGTAVDDPALWLSMHALSADDAEAVVYQEPRITCIRRT